MKNRGDGRKKLGRWGIGPHSYGGLRPFNRSEDEFEKKKKFQRLRGKKKRFEFFMRVEFCCGKNRGQRIMVEQIATGGYQMKN